MLTILKYILLDSDPVVGPKLNRTQMKFPSLLWYKYLHIHKLILVSILYKIVLNFNFLNIKIMDESNTWLNLYLYRI